MLGYRLVRDDDLAYLRAEKVGLSQELRDLRLVIDTLRERLIDAEGSKRSAQTMRDGLITRINQLEEESAVLRHKLTGLPQIAPKIEKGQPLQASSIGAHLDLFEDVGDEEARSLREGGLLHDEGVGAVPPAFPSARALTDHLQ